MVSTKTQATPAIRIGREFVVTADAKRQEIYWALRQEGNRVEGPQVTRRDDANFTVPTIDGMKPDPARMAYAQRPGRR